MLDFMDHTRTSILILTSAADIKLSSISHKIPVMAVHEFHTKLLYFYSKVIIITFLVSGTDMTRYTGEILL